jgi:hypothetical protein
MSESITIPAHIEDGTIRLDAPLPADIERVEVRGYRSDSKNTTALISLISFLESLPAGTRTKDDIDHQIEEERSSWR